MYIFRLIRFPNLLIIVLTQYLLQYVLILPAFKEEGISPVLDPVHFFLFVFVTVLIAAGGYIINDYFDLPIDRVNKPERLIVSKYISAQKTYWLYWGTVISGFLLSVYIAIAVGDPVQSIIYPFACFLMWKYSQSWKRQFLIGNLTVSIFCAFVAGIILYAERVSLFTSISASYNKLLVAQIGGIGYCLFAFFSTLFREIVKDIEDITGDEMHGCKTLPVVVGIQNAKLVAIFVGILFLGLLGTMLYINIYLKYWLSASFVGIAILMPTIYLLFSLYSAADRGKFHHLSQMAKYIMLTGIIYLFFYYK